MDPLFDLLTVTALLSALYGVLGLFARLVERAAWLLERPFRGR